LTARQQDNGIRGDRVTFILTDSIELVVISLSMVAQR